MSSTNIGLLAEQVINQIIQSKLSIQVIESILQEAGVFGEAFAKARAPVDTGFLRDNIGHEVTGLTLKLFSNAPYSLYVDQGTIHQTAQPFITPAAMATEDMIRNRLRSI